MRFITVKELLQELDKYNHKELHVHHTWKPDHDDFNGSNHIQLQRSMRNYHVYNRGWSDIGQHISIFPDGKIVTGRGFGRTPASIKGKNTGSFCIENIGNFDLGRDKLTGEQRQTLLEIARYFDSKDRYVRFHRENSGKTCPGSGVSKIKFMSEIRGDYMFLKKGMTGNEVIELQKDLMKLGYDLPKYGADGSFGGETETALKLFQKQNGLVVDGLFGQNTQAKMKEVLDKRKKEQSYAYKLAELQKKYDVLESKYKAQIDKTVKLADKLEDYDEVMDSLKRLLGVK